ncbi:MAG: hypothetical protein QW255_04155 [Candidatus Bilamarchaeaceae archaeon]
MLENVLLRFERGEENLGRGLADFLLENVLLRFERGEENLGRGLADFLLENVLLILIYNYLRSMAPRLGI